MDLVAVRCTSEIQVSVTISQEKMTLYILPRSHDREGKGKGASFLKSLCELKPGPSEPWSWRPSGLCCVGGRQVASLGPSLGARGTP